MESSKGPKTIHWYSRTSRRELGRFPVPAFPGVGFGVSGTRIVYSSGKRIRLFDTRTWSARTLVTAAKQPSSISVVGNRVIWTEYPTSKMALEFDLTG